MTQPRRLSYGLQKMSKCPRCRYKGGIAEIVRLFIKSLFNHETPPLTILTVILNSFS